ncbi:MAG: hypothetical protein ACEQSR_00715 [Candidatus Methylacidiphilales bacterium]
MRKALLIGIFTLVICLQNQAQNLVGSWKAIIDKDEIEFKFDSTGFATMKSDGETIGGEMFTMDGKKYFMKYTSNPSVTPNRLDLILFDYKTKKEIRRMLAIYSFTTDNKLQICMDTDGNNKRPKDFKNKEDCFKLNKVIKR